MSYIAWQQPILTANGTAGVSQLAVSSGGGATSDVYKAFDNSASSYCNKMNSGAWIQFVTKDTIQINAIKITSQGSLPQSGIFQVSYDGGTTWVQVGTWTDTAGTGTSANIVFDNGSATGNYFRFVSQGKSLAKPNNNADFCNVTITAVVVGTNFKVDVQRRVKNPLLTWKYENYGTADLLSSSGTTLTNLPATQSKTGSAFYQTTRAKCFDLPATPEIWVKFDVYTTLTTRWRAYNGGSAGITGITAQTDGGLSFFSNGTNAGNFEEVVKNQLQTVLLHMVSGATAGGIEAWVDGEFIYRYTGNVNNGADFADIYLQSDGSGTYFSSVYISNVEPETDFEFTASFDTERRVKNIVSVSITFDVVRNVANIAEIANALKVWLPFDVSPTHDICGNKWSAIGNPIIQNNELDLGGSACLNSAVTITNGQLFSICCWFSTTGNDTSVGARLWELTYDGWSFSVGIGGVSFYLGQNQLYYSQAPITGVTTSTQVAPSTVVTDGEKHFLEVFFTGDSYRAATFYLDGVEVAYIRDGRPRQSYSSTTTYRVSVGGHNNYGSVTGGFKGRIDEFQIYAGSGLQDRTPTPPTEDFYRALLVRRPSPITFSAATERKLQNRVSIYYDLTRHALTSLPWRYCNAGTADGMTTVQSPSTDLPETQSITNVAISSGRPVIPPTNEIWIKFDTYNGFAAGNYPFAATTRYPGASSMYHTNCYVMSSHYYQGPSDDIASVEFRGWEGNGLLGRYLGYKGYDVLQTCLLYMKSGKSDGVMELWIDGELIHRHVGNINYGDPFEDISISEGLLSNIIISNVQLSFEDGYRKFKGFETERNIISTQVFNCDLLRKTPHKLIITPVSPMRMLRSSSDNLVETEGVQNITIDLAVQQLTDTVSFTWIHPAEIMEQIYGWYLDYKFDMRIEDITEIGVLRTCYCCSDIDELLYTQAQIGITIPDGLMTVEEANSWQDKENAWYLEYFGVPKYVDGDADINALNERSTILRSAAKKLEVLARIFGKRWVVRFEDFSSTVFFGREVAYTFGDMIRELFGWTSRVPNLLINCYLRDDTLYAVQRGHEANVVDLTGAKHTIPVVRKNLIRLAWGSDSNSYTITTTEPVYTPDEELEADNAAQNAPMTDDSITNKYDDDNLVTQTTIRDDETTTVIDYEYTTTASGRKLLVREITKVTDNDTGDTVEEREVIHAPLADSRSGQGLSVARDEDGETTASVVGQKPFTDKPTPWAKHVHMNGKWYTLTGEQEKEVTINGHALVDTSLPVTDFATKKKFSDAINRLNRKTQEVVSMDVYDFPHVIDFNDRIIFNGAVYFLESNTVTKTPRIINKQSVRFVRWY